MRNTLTLNSSTYNGAVGLIDFDENDFDLVKFGGTNLSDGTSIITTKLNYLGIQQSFDVFDLGDHKFINQRRYLQDIDTKTIIISGVMKQNSRTDLISATEILKGDIVRQINNVYIKDGGVIKFGLAYCQNISFSENYYDITRQNFEISFIMISPLMEYNVQTIGGTGISGSVNINNTGQNYADFFCILTVYGDGAITNPGIKINGTAIYLDGSYSSGDVLIFDSHNLFVSMNGAEVYYTGEFDRISRGSNTFELYDDSTISSYDLNFSWHNTFR